MLSIFPMQISNANRCVQVLFYVWFAICHSRVWTTLGSTIRAPLQGLPIVELVRTAWSKVFQSVSHRGLERTRRGHCHLRGMLPRLLSCLLLVWIVGVCLSHLALQTADGSYSSSFLLFFWHLSPYCSLCFVLLVFFFVAVMVDDFQIEIMKYEGSLSWPQTNVFQGTDYGDAVWGGLVTLKRRRMCCQRNIANQDRDPPTQAEIQDRVQAACGIRVTF